ncbi:MAG: rhamnan synthesis F family protein, partial [Candidatus Pacearchaeota archaeon]
PQVDSSQTDLFVSRLKNPASEAAGNSRLNQFVPLLLAIKQSPFLPRWIVGSWLEEIYTPLLKYTNQVIQIFEENPEVGVIVPEMPLHLQNMLGNSWGITILENQKNCNDLWKKMKLEKQIDFTQLLSVIMPYGNMFWYRPRALKPLFDLNLQAEDFPEEPFPRDGAIAHAIERLPVYIAWSQNYDFRILAHNVLLQSYYEREELTKNLLNYERNLTEQRISETYKKSLSFKVGFFLVHPWKIPNMIYHKLQKFLFQKQK